MLLAELSRKALTARPQNEKSKATVCLIHVEATLIPFLNS